ncbi:DNA-3-methyladenine glycosylase I [Aestuariirhabdus litorea]|uniref:DNA-3-methyladenine glycosylase I n=1 Tax=Aestuariirhabdus litorea TaxID=2528527 RepID=A0A3P3VQ41_9GAMM|nr:DNA-3-methyladenine glycosylase I [Aestuariirhabdus litorea]RRJ84447.1 DNA-3-methyladenine glycosylase I [Aestuariirhabdus litorea]RWW97671.1 DNA-3-methyladenine glycosylase I [Endozoicomonadaceae bacterium GTF-13]
MERFERIRERALERWGEGELVQRLPRVSTDDELVSLSDSDYLSAITRRIFRAGLKHSLVDSKWPAFEEALWGFKPEALALLSEEQIDQLMQNRDLIRHRGKLRTVPVNAQMVLDIAAEHGSVGRFLAQWPCNDITGLWRWLAKRGAHLGGSSGAAFLRMVGKDTFMLSNDVVTALKAQGVVDKAPTSQRDLALVQQAFNGWQAQCGRPLSEISMTLACSVASPR